MKLLLLSLLLLPLAAWAGDAFEPVLLVAVPGDGRYGFKELADRVIAPVAEKAAPRRGGGPAALEGWRVRGSGTAEVSVLSLVPARRGGATDVPGALAALREAVEACRPLFPEGVEPFVDVRPAVLRRDRDGNPVVDGVPESLFLAERSLCEAADPDGVRPAWAFRPLLGPDGTLLVADAAGADPLAPAAFVDCRLPAERFAGARWLSSDAVLVDFGPAGRVAVSRDPATGRLSAAAAPADAPPAVPTPLRGPSDFADDPGSARPAAIVAIPCAAATAELAARLEKPALAAARAALAAAMPGAAPVPVTFHAHDLDVRNGNSGFALLAGPVAAQAADLATNALAAAFAPGAFALPDGCGPARVSRARIEAVPEEGRFRVGRIYGAVGLALDAARSEARIAWLPDSSAAAAALAPGAKLCVALRRGRRDGRTEEEFAVQAAEPLLRLATRALPGATPALATVPGRGAVLVAPLAEGADAAAAADRARDLLAPFAESLPVWVSPPFAGVFAVPHGGAEAADPPAAGRSLVRSALHAADAATPFDMRFLSPENFYLGLDARLDARDAAREAAEKLLPPGFAPDLRPDDRDFVFRVPFLRFPPGLFDADFAPAFRAFASALVGAIRSSDGAAFAALLDPAAAAADPELAADPFARPGLAELAGRDGCTVLADPLDADDLAALRALLPAESGRLDRVVVADVAWSGTNSSARLRLPVFVPGGGASIRIVGPAAWSSASTRSAVSERKDRSVGIRFASTLRSPDVRTPGTDALAAALLRAAAEDAAAPLLSFVHPRFRDGLPDPPPGAAGPAGSLEARFFADRAADYASAPRDPGSLLHPLAHALACAARRGSLDIVFRPCSLSPRAIAHDAPSAVDLRLLGLAKTVGLADAPDLRPLAERIPGLWLAVCAVSRGRDGDDRLEVVAYAIENDGRCGLVPPLPGSFPDLETAGGAAPGATAEDEGDEDDADDEESAAGRETLRLERVDGSGLATELPATDALPVVDLRLGETFVVHLPESAVPGSPSLSHRLCRMTSDDPVTLGLECAGSGSGTRTFSLRVFDAAFRQDRHVFVPERWERDSPPPPEALTWVPAAVGRPFRVYGAWFETADPAAHAAALRDFLADPETAIRAALDARRPVLHPFVLRLHPDPAADEAAADSLLPAAAPLASDPPGDGDLFQDLADAHRNRRLLRFADPTTTPRVDEIDATAPLGPNRRLRATARLEAEPGAGPFPSEVLPLRAIATASVETRDAFDAPWRPEAPPLVLERRAVYRLQDDGRIVFSGDVAPAAPWRRGDRDPDLRHGIAAPLGGAPGAGRLAVVLTLGLPGPGTIGSFEGGDILLGADAFLADPGAPDPFVPGFERQSDLDVLAPHRAGKSTHFLNRLRLVPLLPPTAP